MTCILCHRQSARLVEGYCCDCLDEALAHLPPAVSALLADLSLMADGVELADMDEQYVTARARDGEVA